MKLLDASYLRFLSQTVKHTKSAGWILYDLKVRDDILAKHEQLLDEIYERMKTAASKGKMTVEIPFGHSFWRHKDVHQIFREKGFQVHYDSKSIDWWWDSKENQLR